MGILTSPGTPPSFGLSARVPDKDFFPWAPCSAGRTPIRTTLPERHGPEPVRKRLPRSSGAAKISGQGLPGRALAGKFRGFSLGWGGSGWPCGRQRPSRCDLVTVPLLQSVGSVRLLAAWLSQWLGCSLLPPTKMFPPCIPSTFLLVVHKNTQPNPPIFWMRAAVVQSPGLLTARFDVPPASESQARPVPKIHITNDSSLKWLFNHLSKQQQAPHGAV